MAEHIEIQSFSAKEGEKEIRYSIEEIKNGFIITKSCEHPDKEGHTQYENEKIYSEKNPFAKESENMYDIIEEAISANTNSL